jgi:hypothetical protein
MYHFEHPRAPAGDRVEKPQLNLLVLSPEERADYQSAPHRGKPQTDAFGPGAWELLATGRLPIGRRLPTLSTCPTKNAL